MRVNISGRVSDRDLTVSTAPDVLSHITSDSLDVWCAGGGGIIVDNLISREEGQGVGVVCERIDGREDALQIHGVVGWCGSRTVEGVLGGVDIENQVDTSIVKGLHAGVVVGSVVDGVDTDGVQAQLFELSDIAGASSRVGHGIYGVGRSSWLPIHTTHEESGVSHEESWEQLAIDGIVVYMEGIAMLAYHFP